MGLGTRVCQAAAHKARHVLLGSCNDPVPPAVEHLGSGSLQAKCRPDLKGSSGCLTGQSLEKDNRIDRNTRAARELEALGRPMYVRGSVELEVQPKLADLRISQIVNPQVLKP